jgi:hypothetical protein
MNTFPHTGPVSDLQCLQQGLPQCWQQTTVASLNAAAQRSDQFWSAPMGLYDGFTVALFLGCSGLVSLLLNVQRSAWHQRRVAQLERVWRL